MGIQVVGRGCKKTERGEGGAKRETYTNTYAYIK